MEQTILRASLLCPKALCLFHGVLHALYGYGDDLRGYGRDHDGHDVYDAFYRT